MAANASLLFATVALLGMAALSLHWGSRRYGLAPLLIFVTGLVALVHAVGSVPVYISLGEARLGVSSATVVPVVLMVLLVLYEIEGTATARITIMGMVGLSGMVLLLQVVRQLHLQLPGGVTLPGISADSPVFIRSWRTTAASMMGFVGAMTGVAITFQFLRNLAPGLPRWSQVGPALLVALAVDEVVFRAVGFGWANLVERGPGGLWGKSLGALTLWPLLGVYMARFAPRFSVYGAHGRRSSLELLFGSYRQREQDLLDVERRRRESELRLRTVVDHAPILVLSIDLDGAITLAEGAGLPGSSLNPARVRGRNVASVFPTLADQVRDALEGASFSAVAEVEGRSYDVTFVPATLDGRVTGATAVATDVTERRTTEAALRQAQKMEAVGQLTGGVAHDFNNLLTVIMGGLEIAREAEAAGDAQELDEALNEALAAAARGAALTQRLLAFSRRQALSPRELHGGELLDGVRTLLTRTLGDSVEVRLRIAEDVGRCVVDRIQMDNAILNLALNARDAMPGGGTLTLRADRVQVDGELSEAQGVRPGSYVRISVEDSGHGIPDEVRDRVFEPFFTTKEAGKGSGLGLSMVYGFSRQSGGFVTLDGRKGGGTSVRLHLPATDEAAPAGPDG